MFNKMTFATLTVAALFGCASLTMMSSAAQASTQVPAGTIGLSFVTPPPLVTSTTVVFQNSTFTIAANGTGGFLPLGTQTGLANGTIVFDQTVGNSSIVGLPVNDLVQFSDGAGGQYVFDLDGSVYTESMVFGSSSSIALYLLGDISDPIAGLSLTSASVTLTLNSTNGSNWTASATLSTPPAGVPEPATIAVLGAGLAGLGMIRRRKKS